MNLGSVSEVLEDEHISVTYVPTELQSADVFTKALPPMKWQNALDLLGIHTNPVFPSVAVPSATGGDSKKLNTAKEPAPKVGAGVTAVEAESLLTRCKPHSGVRRGLSACDSMTDELVSFYNVQIPDLEFTESLKTFAAGIKASACASSVCTNKSRPSGKLPGWGRLIELCTHSNSGLGQAASEYAHVSVLRVTADMDLSNPATVEQVKSQLRAKPGTSVHGSLPCTVWSQWQAMACHRYGEAYQAKLAPRRTRALNMLKSFIGIADLALSLGGFVSFEWPRHCTGWLLAPLQQFIARHQLFVADCDGCALGVVDSENNPLLKRWRVVTNSERLATTLSAKRCTCPTGAHVEITGKRTKPTEIYPISMCHTIITALFGDAERVPALPCRTPTQHSHREHVYIPRNFGISPMLEPLGVLGDFSGYFSSEQVAAAVTKLLDRSEMSAPKAMEAIKAEGRALVAEDTWLESTVIEKEDLITKARASKERIHLGDLLTICSIKHFELSEIFHKWKGRICFRGDVVKDEEGAVAIFQELSASPIAVQDANANLAYGAMPGNKTTQTDAIRAYIQSLLKSKHKTWVSIPKPLWHKSWHGKFKRPMCLLSKALYGHPESGAHWERHLTAAVIACGGKPVQDHPSSFWFEKDRMLLSVYVDDLLCSGPVANHDKFWNRLKAQGIKIEPPEDVDRFIGRAHVVL